MIDGYTVPEAASVLGVSKERIWELLARGVLAGNPQPGGDMRVYLQPRPAPAVPAAEQPRRRNGNGEHGSEVSPFRELLTEYRGLTERYGQALLALGEARGEVAAIRQRVELLEARVDLRLPPARTPFHAAWDLGSALPTSQPLVEPTGRTITEPMETPAPETRAQEAAAADLAADVVAAEAPAEARVVEAPVELEADIAEAASAAPPSAEAEGGVESASLPERGKRKRKSRSDRSKIGRLAEALARAEDPTLSKLPGGQEAAEALAAFQETAPSLEAAADEAPTAAASAELIESAPVSAETVLVEEEAPSAAVMIDAAPEPVQSSEETWVPGDLDEGAPTIVDDETYAASSDQPEWYGAEAVVGGWTPAAADTGDQAFMSTDVEEPIPEPTESMVEPAESMSEPAEGIAEPAEGISEPIESVAEPWAEPAEQVGEPADPVAEPIEPMAQLAEPTWEPVEPVAEPAEEIEEPTESMAERVEPWAGPSAPAAEPVQASAELAAEPPRIEESSWPATDASEASRTPDPREVDGPPDRGFAQWSKPAVDDSAAYAEDVEVAAQGWHPPETQPGPMSDAEALTPEQDMEEGPIVDAEALTPDPLSAEPQAEPSQEPSTVEPPAHTATPGYPEDVYLDWSREIPDAMSEQPPGEGEQTWGAGELPASGGEMPIPRQHELDDQLAELDALSRRASPRTDTPEEGVGAADPAEPTSDSDAQEAQAGDAPSDAAERRPIDQAMPRPMTGDPPSSPWTPGPRGPAARAYRRLRRIFPE